MKLPLLLLAGSLAANVALVATLTRRPAPPAATTPAPTRPAPTPDAAERLRAALAFW